MEKEIGTEAAGAADGPTPGLLRTEKGQRVEEGALPALDIHTKSGNGEMVARGGQQAPLTGPMTSEKHFPWAPHT